MVDELALAGLVLAALALISCLSVPDRRTIRRMPRALWVTAILLVPLAGPAGWFLLGRPRPTGPPRSWRSVVGRPEPPPAPAPDDDPTFLRSLDPPEREPERPDGDPHR